MTPRPVRPHENLGPVLIGSALDASSDDILRAGFAWAQGLHVAARVVHSMPHILPADPQAAWTLAIEVEQRVELDKLLATQVTRCAGGVPATAEVLSGPAHRVLSASARHWNACLLAVGAVSDHHLHSVELGSTADRVVRQAPCPVLVVRRSQPFPPRRVLAAVDLSRLSGEALHSGLRLIESLESQPQAIEVVFALGLYEAADLRHRHRLAVDAAASEVERLAASDLAAFLDEFAADSRLSIAPRILHGNARQTLSQDIAMGRHDLVLIGTHGKGGFERLLTGSVATHILRHTEANILVIPPEAAIEDSLAEAVRTQTAPAL
jgi:nucleotide-binding universal stress UspA family protein